MPDTKQLARESVQMLQKYYDSTKNLSDGQVFHGLSGEDLNAWKNIYYPQLVQSGLVVDGQFFGDVTKSPNLGIGADGSFHKYEYVHYLYSAYKYFFTDFTSNTGTLYLKECIDTLEPYLPAFQNHSTETSDAHSFNSADSFKWKYEYYPYFSKSGLIPDGQFFGDVIKNPDFGIGVDGRFKGQELCHFLYKLYKFADTVTTRNIPTWKVLFLLCKHTAYGGTDICLSQQDIADMKNAIRRFQNFVFAFSGGNVAIDVETREPSYAVKLRKVADDNYYIDIGDLLPEDGWNYVVDNSKDFAMYYARFGKFPTKWLAVTSSGTVRFGSLTRNFSYINLKGLEGIPNNKYLEPSETYPFPEECAVHESLHVFQYVLEQLFGKGPLVNPDQAGKYGYANQTPNAPIGGFYSFYEDALAGRVKDASGNLIGIKPEMWVNTMRNYNNTHTGQNATVSTSNSVKATSATPETGFNPVVSDLRINERKINE